MTPNRTQRPFPRLRRAAVIFAAALLALLLAACGTDATPAATESGATADATPAAAPTARPTDTAAPPTYIPTPTAAPATPHPSPTTAASTTPPETPAATPDGGASAGFPALHTAFPAPPDRDVARLARELWPEVSVPAPGERAAWAVGDLDELWLFSFAEMQKYRSPFELRLVSANAYWWVEQGAPVEQEGLERSAAIFEEVYYPRVTAVFGGIDPAGLDADPRLHIVNGLMPGVGGYFSGDDRFPQAIRSGSNEREAIYINIAGISPGNDYYDQIVLHELQHAIHSYADANEDTWVNEGLSELAVTIAGLPTESIRPFLRSRPISLVHWPVAAPGGAANYGAATLFMHYLTEHYGGRDDLRPLLQQAQDGAAGVDAYLELVGGGANFEAVFGDWAIANLLDEDGGKYGYANLDITAPVYRRLRAGTELESEIPQYSTEYITLVPGGGAARLIFQGRPAVPLLPVEVGPEGCWWSNSGDSIGASLTRRLDLRRIEQPQLDFEVWFDIEEHWDYAYLQASTDGGQTWDILATAHTDAADPLDTAFGPGYTGISDGWLAESVSLTDYAGREIRLRLQYITDDATNSHGLCLRRLAVSDAATGGAALRSPELGGWQPDGFVFTGNRVQQRFIVQLIREGAANQVQRLALDAANYGELLIAPPADGERLTLAVQPLAPATRLDAHYTLRLAAAE